MKYEKRNRELVSILQGTVLTFLSPTASLATNRLQAIFARCLLRRKKDSQLDGKRLIELPDKNVLLCKLDFTKDERDVYNMVRYQAFHHVLSLTGHCRLRRAAKEFSIAISAQGLS